MPVLSLKPTKRLKIEDFFCEPGIKRGILCLGAFIKPMYASNYYLHGFFCIHVLSP